MADALKDKTAPDSTTPSVTNTPTAQKPQLTHRISLKINPAPSANSTTSTPKIPLTVPIINPAIKAALSRINQQSTSTNTPKQIIVNTPTTTPKPPENPNTTNGINKSTVKIIAVNTSGSPGTPMSNNKKFLIINNSSSASKTVTSSANNGSPVSNGTAPSNLVKIINFKTSSSSSSPMTSRPVIMINAGAAKPVINLANGTQLVATSTSQVVASTTSSQQEQQQNQNSSNQNSSS